jgi:DNA sulfur modification protein DndB
MRKITIPMLQVTQLKRKFWVTRIPAKVLVDVSYVAIRRRSEEKGAVQRILNEGRINSIKEFTLNVGEYPGAIILNWNSQENPIEKRNNTISFKQMPNSAQIVDGQHRLAGIQAAMKENKKIETLELPVVIYENLSTQECADIFLSINTEQKPVPRSLVFDLYGVASETLIDPAALRARDISIYLNEDSVSPYFECIKLPNTPVRKGGIALSTAVTAIKPLVEEKGDFDRVSVDELELQKKILLNFFVALREKYADEWYAATNAFMYAAGFMGAIDFFRLKIIPYCNLKGSYTAKTISEVIKLKKDNLIYQEVVKGLGGKDSPKVIYELLVEAFENKAVTGKGFEY